MQGVGLNDSLPKWLAGSLPGEQGKRFYRPVRYKVYSRNCHDWEIVTIYEPQQLYVPRQG